MIKMRNRDMGIEAKLFEALKLRASQAWWLEWHGWRCTCINAVPLFMTGVVPDKHKNELVLGLLYPQSKPLFLPAILGRK
jgi:hypothetical protein